MMGEDENNKMFKNRTVFIMFNVPVDNDNVLLLRYSNLRRF